MFRARFLVSALLAILPPWTVYNHQLDLQSAQEPFLSQELGPHVEELAFYESSFFTDSARFAGMDELRRAFPELALK